MKKILLTTAAAVILSTSSVYAAEDMFYVKANVGWSKLTKISGLKSNNDVFFGVGAGYYVMQELILLSTILLTQLIKKVMTS